MKRLALILLICSGSCWAQIARTGSGSATTGVATLSGVATGDLKICFAYISASRTAPSVPAGWTLIESGASTSGGTTGAMASACNKATGPGDTGSGTWGTHTTLQCAAYSGTGVNVAANCDTTGLSRKGGVQSAKTSTTVSYTLGGMAYSDNLDWVVGFAAGSAGIPAAPSDLTSVATSGTAPASRLSDTNTHVASWADSTASVASGTWLSDSVELSVAIVGVPSVSPTAGNFTTSQTVSMSDATAGATICYTTDLTAPAASTPGTCSNGSTYSSSFAQNSYVTLETIGTKSGNHNSTSTYGLYTFGMANTDTFFNAGGGLTSSAIDTTNATLIVLFCAGTNTGGSSVSPSVTDSQSNIYIQGASTGTTRAATYFYKLSPSTSASHTFTCTTSSLGTPTRTTLKVIAFQSPYFGTFTFDSGCATATGASPGTTCASSLTPAVNNDLLIDTIDGQGGSYTGIGSSLNLLVATFQGSDSGTASAFYSDPNTTAINPAWTYSSATNPLSALLAFSPAVGGTPCSNSTALTGVGCR